MVATKQGNGPRKPPPKQGNANRRFKPPVMNGNKQQHQQHRLIPQQMQQQLPRFNTRAAAAGISAMFNTNQMLDNPGYVDFNEPTPQQRQPIPAKNPPKQTQSGNSNNSNKNNRGMRRSNQPNMKNMPPPLPQRNQNNKNGWTPPRMPPSQMSQQHPPPPPPPHGGRNFRNPPMPRLGGRPMPPPMGMRPPMCPPPPPPNMTPGRFGPRPLIPPPLAGCPPLVPLPMGPPRLPIRGGPMPPRPLLPRGGVGNGPPSGGGGGPIRRGKILPNNRKNMKNRKRPIGNGNSGPPINSNGNKNVVQVKKSTTTRKTLSEIVNQYPLDKPWVTDEIRAEQKKKDDIENRLKGHKDDKLFAEFKVQRDKFVKMYETARLEYIGKHPEQDIDKILTESSDKNKGETNANTKAKPNDNRKTNEKSAAT